MSPEAQAHRAERFRALHVPGQPLLLPNPWDAGSARLLASLGFEALATTSSGHAATLGRVDGRVSREEALAHAAAIVGATELPVSADLENGLAETPEGVAETARQAMPPGSPASRSRTRPAAGTIRSSPATRLRSGSPPRPRPRTRVRSGSS